MNWMAECIVVLWFLPVVVFFVLPLLLLAFHTLFTMIAGLLRTGTKVRGSVIEVRAKV